MKSKTRAWPLLIIFLAAPGFAQDRTAMVIANFDYGEHRLASPRQDAAVVAKALAELGFRVDTRENLDAKELRTAVDAFAAGQVTGGAAVLYFAGLGGQYPTGGDGSPSANYLLGAGPPRDNNRPDRDGLTLAELLKILHEKQQARHTLLLLDCGLHNPFPADSHPTGLAAIEADALDANMLVCTAAPPGKVVGDADDQMASAFAAAWARRLPLWRESLRKTLDAVREDVQRHSGMAPWWVAGSESIAQHALRDSRAFLRSDIPREGSEAGQEWINGVGMVFCWCPAGTFTMGERDPGPDSADAEPVEVTLSKGFWMSKYEVTQREYKVVRGRDVANPLTLHNSAPLHNVEMGNADAFCKMLTESERKAGRLPGGWEYTLPTEAEWEYACRAGSTTRYSFGDDPSHLPRYSNFADAALLADDGSMQFADGRYNDGVGKGLALVGSYQANAWGLHDMHGNVWEWCRDRYAPQLPGGVDPLSEEKADYYVIRGGAWCSMPHYCASAFRNSESPGNRRDFMGVRVVLKQRK